MTNPIFKKSTFLILIILLALAGGYILILQNQIDRLSKKDDLKGTYICGQPTSSAAEYFTFTSDYEYSRFRQLQVAERGSYKKESSVIRLFPQNNKLEYSAIFADDKIFLFENQKWIIFKKYSDIPTELNVTTRETTPVSSD